MRHQTEIPEKFSRIGLPTSVDEKMFESALVGPLAIGRNLDRVRHRLVSVVAAETGDGLGGGTIYRDRENSTFYAVCPATAGMP